MLRKHKISDAEPLYHKIGCDSEMERYTGWNPYVTIEAAREAIREFMENYDHPNFYGWAIVPDCWNKGYATVCIPLYTILKSFD